METGPVELTAAQKALEGVDAQQGLMWVAATYGSRAAFSSSLGLEDQVITHMLAQGGTAIRIFTLDTGRLFEETYKTLAATRAHFGVNIEVYAPDTGAVQALVSQKGPYSFYESLANRKECCDIRKVKPLKRALAGTRLWVTGIRGDQNAHRSALPQVEWDAAHSLVKYHPLLHWTDEQVRSYLKEHQVPHNVLHDRGFPSIGCAPCTRAVPPGADPRSGRWWWEHDGSQECGLHVTEAPMTVNA